MQPTYMFKAELWEYPGKAAWHFVTLPAHTAREVESMTGPFTHAFGSIRVKATIDGTSWDTSIFPESKNKSYVLPVKKEIRAKHDLRAGIHVDVTIELEDIL